MTSGVLSMTLFKVLISLLISYHEPRRKHTAIPKATVQLKILTTELALAFRF